MAREQLLALGVTRDSIRRRLEDGWLHRVHLGVYAVGHTGLERRGRYLAAVLACGPGAKLSHRSAAALWRLLPDHGGPVDVTGLRRRRGIQGLRLHRPRNLSKLEGVLLDAIPVTKVPDTLLDVGESESTADLEAAFDEAFRRRLTSLPALDRVMAHNRGRHGLRPLRTLVEERRRAPTRSEFERRFLDFCRDLGLPVPQVNAHVSGLMVDCLWLRRRLIVELDGWAYHDGRAAFERDHARSLGLEADGYRVLRVTWRQLRDTPETVEAALRERLGPP